MSDLQLALTALGAVLVAAVVGYNALQERRARRRAEAAFRSGHPDALLQASAERREPVMGELAAQPLEETVPDEPGPGEAKPPNRVSPAAVISHRIDTIAIILADEPVAPDRLEPLRAALASCPTPVHFEGLVDEQWMPAEDLPGGGWRELRVGMQLASRTGAVTEADVAAFAEAVADFATSTNAVSQRENPAAAAARARELDRFCAEVDVEVAVNVVGRAGATFALSRLDALALENGFAQTGAGAYERRAADKSVSMTLKAHEDGLRREASYATGIAFALDIPRAADPVAVLLDMGRTAEAFAQALGGELVDDERRPLGAAGFAAIERSLETVVRRMEAQGIPAGGALARRLFS